MRAAFGHDDQRAAVEIVAAVKHASVALFSLFREFFAETRSEFFFNSPKTQSGGKMPPLSPKNEALAV